MALTINTNISSLMVQLSLQQSSLELNRALEQMTTGYRINSAKDDAAGYAVAKKMDINLSSYEVAQNNTMLGISLLNTASSSLDLVTTHLQRMRDLAEQAANGTYGADSISAIQSEIDSRTEEINRVMSTTEYNGIKLFQGDGTGTTRLSNTAQIDSTFVLTSDVQPRNASGNFVSEVTQLTEEEAIQQGYTIIKTVDDLDNIRKNLSGKYILMNDIDLSSISDWEPIGDYTNYFSGEFNGNGYVIKNLTINRPNESNVGLFGYISGGKIKNVGMENVNIVGNSFVGGLVGYVYSMNYNYASITDCYATGSVSGTGYSVGGLVGQVYSNSSSITDCYATVSVIGTGSSVGGLVGEAYSNSASTPSYITNSYATGSVTGSGNSVGGLVGQVSNYFLISNSYATGRVNGTANSVGGLAGSISSYSYIRNSYATGRVNGEQYVGGLVGTGTGTITNSYATGSVKGSSYVGGLVGMADASSLYIYISKSYATGSVTGSGNYVGGLVGYVAKNQSINGYFDKNKTGQINGVGGGTYTGTVTGVTSAELQELINNGTLPKYDYGGGDDTGEGSNTGRGFTLQIGINSNENSKITFDTALGFTLDIDVSTTENARNALEQIDAILEMITSKQTEFGAVQNRLDSVLDSLNVSIENTTSSLSTIRDADIAKVSADYIRAQILQQASSSLLATANQAPSIALNLI